MLLGLAELKAADGWAIRGKRASFEVMSYAVNFFFGYFVMWRLQQLFAVNRGQCHWRDPKNRVEKIDESE